MSGQGRARPGAELCGLQGVRSLGLQRNRIEKIENLGCFPNLRVLSLAGNRIRRVQNLRPLRQLRSLDLSQNLIQTLDPDELPRSLRLLDLTGNACTQQPGYRELVVGALPHLLQLDTRPLRGCTGPALGEEEEEEEEEGSPSSEDDEELFFEPSAPFTADKDFFADLHQELAGRSQRRRGEALEEHRSRLQELRGLLLPPPPGSAGTEPCRAPSPGEGGAAPAPGPRQAQPRPHMKQGARPRPPPRAGPAAPAQRGPARGGERHRSKEAGSSPRSRPRRSSSGD
uniref:Leucine rich repeat containing 46 n=1 Tax=Cairina moschata TaxID=8855 RepID=A0A8C3C2H3_CAIMO